MPVPSRSVSTIVGAILALSLSPLAPTSQATVPQPRETGEWAQATAVPTHGAMAFPAVSATRPQRKIGRIRIASFNTFFELSPGRAMHDLRRLFANKLDIVALQEMSSGEKRSRLRKALVDCRRCRWGAFMPRSAVPGGLPILFRRNQYKLVDTGMKQVSGATRVGRSGAGPSVIRPKWITWVKLIERRTGRTVHVLNNHTVPTVQGAGGRPNRRHPARLRLYRQHMAGLTTLVSHIKKKQGGLVFVTGDFNVNYRTDKRAQAAIFPYATMRALNMRATFGPLGEPARGTHDPRARSNSTRLIDYVHFLRRDSVKPTEQRILRGYSSDHRPVAVGFEVTPKRHRR